mgnify:CR=1 FL=1|jgi:hypothetical protein|tara:strand:- start:18492 stop:18740 length:249 start_codon:yes stop_codon:yes gene_type:complete
MVDTEIPKGHGSWHGGKGSAPKDTDQKKYADNYDAIFGKKADDLSVLNADMPAPVNNDGPPIPNGLKAAWERQSKKVDKKEK